MANTKGSNFTTDTALGATDFVTGVADTGGGVMAERKFGFKAIRNPVNITVTISATPTINTDNGDVFRIGISPNFLNVAITSMTTNLTGTPAHGERVIFEYLDNGTGRAITHGAKFRGTGLTTTVANKLSREVCMWDSADSVWDILATWTEP